MMSTLALYPLLKLNRSMNHSILVTIVHKCFNDIDDPWLNMYLHNECNE